MANDKQIDNLQVWHRFDSGKSLGQIGSEDGIIVRDEEHPDGARITIEEGGRNSPFSITCGIYSWAVHTRFLSTRDEAEKEYELMKEAIEDILAIIPPKQGLDENADARRARMHRIGEACERFVKRFP